MRSNYLSTLGAIVLLAACSSPSVKMVGKWADEEQERDEIEIIEVNDKPAFVKDGKTFPIEVKEDEAMSVDLGKAEMTLLYDVDKDLIFLNGTRYIREEKRQRPHYVGVYGTKPLGDTTGVFLHFAESGAVITSCDPSDPLASIMVMNCRFKEGRLEHQGREYTEDSEYEVHYQFMYDHARKAMIWSDVEDGKVTELKVLQHHAADAGADALFALAKDRYTGKWKAYDSEDGVVEGGIDQTTDFLMCEIRRVGPEHYQIDFGPDYHGFTNEQVTLSKTRRGALVGRASHSYQGTNEIVITDASSGHFLYQDPMYEYLLIRP